MRLALDSEKCQGHARCVVILPEVFDTDAFGHALMQQDGEVPPGRERAAHQATNNCPEHAITIVEQ